MSRSIVEDCFPEMAFGGYTRVDGAIAFFQRVQALLEPAHVVLDLGCGRGKQMDDPSALRRNLQDYRNACARVIGIDVDAVGQTNPYIHEFRLIEDPRHWPVEDASIDLVVCNFVLEHIADPDSFFAEARRVLKLGGALCLRTPNSLSYVALASRLVPNRMHARVVGYAQLDRKEKDVFPTYYRCNTKGRLRRLLARHGFEGCIYRHEGQPAYLTFSRLVYRIGILAHRFLPDTFKSTLLGFSRRVS